MAFRKLFLLQLLVQITGVSSLMCYSCQDLADSEQCFNIIQCTDSEICYGKTDNHTSGAVKHTTGCTDPKVTMSTLGQPTLCYEPCRESFCNLQSCSTQKNVTRGPRCPSCEFVWTPQDCKSVAQCNTNEKCFVQKFEAFSLTRYRMGCVSNESCGVKSSSHLGPTIVGKRDTRRSEDCVLCCSKDHCNSFACHNSSQDLGITTLYPLADRSNCSDSSACDTFGFLDENACRSSHVVEMCPASCQTCGFFGWETWQAWSKCSHTCDEGTIVRQRQCIHQFNVVSDPQCGGESRQETKCNERQCLSTTLSQKVTAALSTLPLVVLTTSAPIVNACVDMLSNCAEFGRGGCTHTVYGTYLKLHCAKYCGLCSATTLSSKVTAALSTIPSVVSTTSAPIVDACVDTDSDCDTFGREYICSSSYEPWAKLHCANYCGLCGATTLSSKVTAVLSTIPSVVSTTSAPIVDACVDTDPDCASYGREYICQSDYEPWAKLHRAKYCGLCGATTLSSKVTAVLSTIPSVVSTTSAPIVVDACVDTDSNCASFGRDYICSSEYEPWAKLHCAKFCGLCGVETTSAPSLHTTIHASTTKSTTITTCTDRDTKCHTYPTNIICAKPSGRASCLKYCGLCK